MMPVFFGKQRFFLVFCIIQLLTLYFFKNYFYYKNKTTINIICFISERSILCDFTKIGIGRY